MLEEVERQVGRQKRVARTRSDKETGKTHRKRKREGAKLAPSPLERRREKELLLHLGPEGAPWGQPSETRALWTRIYHSTLIIFFCQISLMPIRLLNDRTANVLKTTNSEVSV